MVEIKQNLWQKKRTEKHTEKKNMAKAFTHDLEMCTVTCLDFRATLLHP